MRDYVLLSERMNQIAPTVTASVIPNTHNCSMPTGEAKNAIISNIGIAAMMHPTETQLIGCRR